MREKLTISLKRLLESGITPASAGKTGGYNANENKEEDHPRECGKNYLAKWGISREQGSPPRVREKLLEL